MQNSFYSNKFEIAINKETPLQFFTDRGVYIRYAYSRSRDSIITDSLGQDFFCWTIESNKLVFALTDGVGGSFNGFIAATFLGKKLSEWLLSADSNQLYKDSSIEILLRETLTSWAPECQDLVNKHKIETHLPKLLIESLENIKTTIGSETMFICGRIDNLYEKTKKVVIIGAGDSQIQLFNRSEKEIRFLYDTSSKNRWSSKIGLIGKLNFWTIDSGESLDRFVVFSDGLSHQSTNFKDMGDREITKTIHSTQVADYSDDISLMDVVLPDEIVSHNNYEKKPINLEDYKSGIDHQLRWDGNVSNTYELEISDSFGFWRNNKRIACTNNSYIPAFPSAGTFYTRVRGIDNQNNYPWSNAIQIIISGIFPGKPTLKAENVTYKGETINLEWDPVPNADFYILERAQLVSTGMQYTFHAAYIGTETKWTGKIDPKREAIFRLKAVNVDGASEYCEAIVRKSELLQPKIAEQKPSAKDIPIPRVDSENASTELANLKEVSTNLIEEKSDSDNKGFDDSAQKSSDLPSYWADSGKLIDDTLSRSDVSTIVNSTKDNSSISYPDKPIEGINLVAHQKPSLYTDRLGHSTRDRLFWSDIGAQNYEIKETSTNRQGNLLTTCLLEWNLPEDMPPGEYFYQVRGKWDNHYGEWSNQVKINIEALELNKPGNFKIICKPGKLQFSWVNVNNASFFEIWESSIPFSIYEQGQILNSVTTNGYLADITKHQPGIFHFRARAKSPYKNSDWSEVCIVSINVSSLKVTANNGKDFGKINVEWNHVQGCDSYKLQQRRNREAFSDVLVTRETSCSLTINEPGYYDFRVIPIFPGGHGTPSLTTKSLLVPKPITNIPNIDIKSINEKQLEVKFRIDRENEIEGYILEMVLDTPDFRPEKVESDNISRAKRSKKINITGNVTYYFRVRAHNYSGYGPWSEIYYYRNRSTGRLRTVINNSALNPRTYSEDIGDINDPGIVVTKMQNLLLKKNVNSMEYQFVKMGKQPGDEEIIKQDLTYVRYSPSIFEPNQQYIYRAKDTLGNLYILVFKLKKPK